MGFEVIIIGAIAGFFVIKQLTKSDVPGNQGQVSASDEPVVRPYPSARENPRHRPNRHHSASVVTSKPHVTNNIPEDSSLKRHYLQNLESERLAVTDPYPTEFNLKRHFQTEMNQLLDLAEKAESKPSAKSAKPVGKVVAPKEPKKVDTPENAKAKPKATPKPKAETKTKAKVETKTKAEPKTKPKAKPAKTKSEVSSG